MYQRHFYAQENTTKAQNRLKTSWMSCTQTKPWTWSQSHGVSTGTEPHANQLCGVWQCCTWMIGERTTGTRFLHRSDAIVDLWQRDEPQYTAGADPHVLPAVLSRASSWTRAPVESLEEDMCISHLVYNIPQSNAGKIPKYMLHRI